jgi:hypothetical protein
MLKKPAPVIVIAASVLLQACQPSGPRPKDDQPWDGTKENPTELTMQFSVGWSEEVHYTYFLGEGEGSVVELRILDADHPQWEFAERFEWPGGLGDERGQRHAARTRRPRGRHEIPQARGGPRAPFRSGSLYASEDSPTAADTSYRVSMLMR